MKTKTYSHDAIRYLTRPGETQPCDKCRDNLIDHDWITLRLDGTTVACSNEKKGLTGFGTTV